MRELYEELLDKHGPQGWWPLLDEDGESIYSTQYPLDEKGQAEIAIGAILTQNTNWQNVNKALRNLKRKSLLDWQAIVKSDIETLQETIRPSGYYRQKAKKLKIAAEYFNNLQGQPHREDLLALWGVGPETADSIMCYAYGTCDHIVDAYLRRVLKQRGHEQHDLPYQELKAWVSEQLPEDPNTAREFHALIVAEGQGIKSNPGGKKPRER